jgi:hypothetical protein
MVQFREYRASSVLWTTPFGMEVKKFVVEDFQSEASRLPGVYG